MKILLAIDYYQPQLGYSEGFIVKELSKLGHEVTVLTSNYYFPFPNYEQTAGKILGPRVIKSGIKIENGIKVIREKLKFELFARAILGGQEKHLKTINPDIVIANKVMGYNTIRFAQLKNKFGYKLIAYDSHLPSELNREHQLLKKIFYGIFKTLFSGVLNSQIDKFIAVQEKTVDVMRDYYGITKKIDVIPLGTDINQFKLNSQERSKIRKKYEINSDDFVIIYTGKLIESKGVEILFQAFNRLCKNKLKVRLIIVGEGNQKYTDLCLSKIDKEYQDKIIWIEFQRPEALHKYYSASEVGVWPLQESTSMNDSASNSLPFIANDTLGDKTRISNRNALLYKKGDCLELAKKIEYLYNNPDKRKIMGKKGRELAEEKLSWKIVAAKFLQ